MKKIVLATVLTIFTTASMADFVAVIHKDINKYEIKKYEIKKNEIKAQTVKCGAGEGVTRRELESLVRKRGKDTIDKDGNRVPGTYADLSNICTSNIKDFSFLFGDLPYTFNQDIGDWDVSKGTNFKGMFAGAYTFNQDIGNWDVSKGTSFDRMFAGVWGFFSESAFNQDIGDWDVSKGTSFNGMFADASAFNQDIGDWDVSKGTDFNYMFYEAKAFNQDISRWDVNNSFSWDDFYESSALSLSNVPPKFR